MFEPFTERARAKVNLALHVLGRRPDGYHELDSIVAFAEAGDSLRFSPADEFSISADGPFARDLPTTADNTIAKAYRKVAEIAEARGKVLPAVSVHLTKNLPVAAGIGGGSANAAAAMRGFLKIAGITGPDDAIMAAALTLGADVPVCLMGCTCRMQGIGERLTPLDDFPELHTVLVNPNVAVPTAEVFRKLGLAPGQSHGSAIADVGDPSTWRNDLTDPAIADAPVIGEALSLLRDLPDVRHVTMSGSGATCLALFVGAAPRDLGTGLLPPGWWLSF